MTAPRDTYQQFAETWSSRPGFWGWLGEVNNQPLGIRFMVTSFAFFLVGGMLALVMRIQLTVSESNILGPQVYNQLFTMHGSTMMYLFAVPFLEGLSLYLLPLMIGSRDVAFPRLTAFSYWTYLFGGLIFYASFVAGAAPEVGWFAYTPLSSSRYSGLGTDFWVLGLGLVEVAGIGAGVEIVVSILKLRAPGMSINRMPLFVWAMLVAGMMIIFAFTTLLTATVLLELDRAVDTRFFDQRFGGTPLLWQHLFWFFGHPEVYIIFIPATGIVSMVVGTFAGRIMGYTLIAVAILVTGFLSFGLWVHHMYTTGLPELSMNFFLAASLMIALASGTQVFAWIASLWGRRPALKVPLLYVLGFLFIFLLGGLTGVMVAIVPFDWQVHDTFFIVAHFHYVLIGGAVFPILAGLHFWIPKITGRMLGEGLGVWSFWLAFIGFNATFFPMHIMGLLGMPRRVYTYSAELGIDGYNILASVGAFVFAAAFLMFLLNLVLSMRRGDDAGDNPYNGDSLEWSLPSPPPIYSYLRPPIVHSLHPTWGEQPLDEGNEVAERATAALQGAPSNFRATLSTEVLHARPQGIQYLPSYSHMPLWAAIGLLILMVGVLADYFLLMPLGAAFAVGALFGWLRPSPKQLRMLRDSDISERAGLPLFATGPSSTAWWGMVSFLAIAGTVFAAMFYSYYYIRLFSPTWPQDGLPPPNLLLPGGTYLALVTSGVAWYWADRNFRRGERTQTWFGLGAALSLGLLFVALHWYEISTLSVAWDANAYGSLLHAISWTLNLLVLTGIAFMSVASYRLRREYYDREGFMGLEMQLTSLLWYFTVVVAILVFGVLYLSPHVLRAGG